MKYLIFSISMGIMCLAFDSFCAEHSYKKLHPYALLSKDYGILTKADFKGELIATEAFDINSKEFSVSTYWQCFKRDLISVQLEELGYSSEDIGWHDNYSNLTFKVVDDNNIRHIYGPRKIWPIPVNLEKFNTWLKLMENEKYVCIAGSEPWVQKINGNTIVKREIYWTFEQLKTKKGCDSYFLNGCTQ